MLLNIRQLFLVGFLLCITFSNAQPTTSQQNPLLVRSNEPLKFDAINASNIKRAVADVIKLSDGRIYNITSNTSKAKSLAATLFAFDELSYEITEVAFKLGLISGTYLNDSARDAANDGSAKLAEYASNIYLNESLYTALQMYSVSPFARILKPNQKKFLKETMLAFEKNGMKLDAAKRMELQVLNQQLINYGIQFDRNIAESKDSIEFAEQELKGVPDNTKSPWKRSNGKYLVQINGPNYVEVMNNAISEETRRKMFMRENNRAFPANIKVLDSLFFYRDQFAKKLGFSSYAAYSVVDKMAQSPVSVWKFENDLAERLAPNVTLELNELKKLKKEFNPTGEETIYDWDLSFYKKKLLDTRYKLNTDELKDYFEMNNTIQGMFQVYEKLFNIHIKEVQNVPVWYSKVKAFDMYKDTQKIGSFYLDLYPRQDKYTHFACFPISQYRVINGKELLPVSALICNFPEATAVQPSLLRHSDVVTLFHEFGHLVHSMLGRSDIASQGPFNVKGDFTEAPSQFLENWVWQYESLSMFAKHYKTGQPLPIDLFNKLKQTQQVGIAIQYIRQVSLGLLDFTYEDKYSEVKKKGVLEISREMNAIRQVPFSEGAHFITSFGHLNGYAANYYGYLWSKVFAEDMFSVFKKNGVMDTKTGVSYRENILEKSSTMDEKEMLRNFLGREPNSNAFLESLGIKN